MERYIFKIIPRDELRPSPYACRYRLNDETLKQSIAEKGLLFPLVISRAPERTVVSGHRRFQAALDLEIAEIPVLELTRKYSSEDLFLLSIMSQWGQRLTELDRAWTLHRARAHFRLPEAKIVEEILPILGFPPQRAFLVEAFEVMTLNRSLLDRVAGGILPYRGLRALTRWTHEDQQIFADRIVGQVSLTSNQLLQISDWIYDLLKTRATGLEKFLEETGLLSFLLQKQGDKRQKAETLFSKLRAFRNPRLVEKEKQFTQSTQEILETSKELSLEAPASFEGEGFVLRARIRQPQSLDKVLDLLDRKRSLLKSLFDSVL